MSDHLYGGTLFDFDTTDNMAKAIEDAYRQMRISAGITQALPTGLDAQDMRILFLAIARGVIAHLAAHPEAFEVEVNLDVNGDPSHGSVTNIDSFT
jgi:hypothetical protein